jgi:hypothetical protein
MQSRIGESEKNGRDSKTWINGSSLDIHNELHPDDTVTIYVTGLAVCCGYGGCGRIAHSDMICQYMMD